MRRPFLLAAALAAAATAAGAARADDVTLPFQVPDARQGLQLVTDFERKAKKGDWTGAVDHLQQLLDWPAGDPLVIRATGMTPARFEGAVVVARRLFDALPPEGRAAWEKSMRGRAEDLLSRGLRLHREQDLRDAARRYPAKDVRRRAFDALAQFAIVRADLTAAQFHLDSLYDATEPPERPEVLARMAWTAAQAGDAETLARVRRLAEPYGDEDVPSVRGAEELRAFLDRMGKVAGPSSAATRQFSGDAHGSGLDEPPPVPGEVRWQAATEFQQGTENSDDEVHASYRDRVRMVPAMPLVWRGLVLVNNGLSLTAVNLSSGSPAWRHETRQTWAEWRDHFGAAHTPSAADGLVYAALATRAEKGDLDFERHFSGHTIVYAMPHRVLHAFDERSGEVVWSHETGRLAGRPDAAEIEKESVASPPLVVGDDVIVTAWTYEGIYDLRLVCYDRRTGATRWRTTVVSGQQEMNLFGRPVKELFTGPLAELNGRIYFATGLGVAAAVEREDGRIAWLSAYEQSPLPPAYRWYQTMDRRITWWMSPVAATPDGVVMAPPDGATLLCFDPANGTRRWTSAEENTPSARASEHVPPYRWFLGVTGGRAFIAGSRVLAIDVKSGRKAWSAADAGRILVPRASVPLDASGLGLLTPTKIYVPTDRAVVVFSTATGAVEETWPLPSLARGQPPVTGALVSGDGALVIANHSAVYACYRPEDLLARLEARLAQNPDDVQARVEAGEAQAASGNLDLAIRTLDAGLKKLPTLAARARERAEPALRGALHRAHLARAEIRFAARNVDGAAEDLRRAAEVARDRGDAVRALFALAETYQRAGRAADEESALRRIVTELPDTVTTTREGERAHAGALAMFLLGESAWRGGRSVDALARWLDLLERHPLEDLGGTDAAQRVRDRLRLAREREPEVVDAAVRARARKVIDAARAARDVAALDRAARVYPDPELAVESALLASELHLEAGRYADAIGVLSAALDESHPPRIAVRALWKLALAYRGLGEVARERAVLRRIARDAPEETIEGAGGKAKDVVARELASPRFVDARTSLPDPRPPLALLWQAGGSDATPALPLRIAGADLPELAGRMVMYRAGVVDLVNTPDGTVVWSRTVNVDVRAAACVPGAIVLCGSDTASRDGSVAVMSLSIADGRQLWRRGFSGLYRWSESSLGVMYVILATRPNHALAAIALATGDVLHVRTFDGALKEQIAAAEDAVVVTQPVSRGGGGLRRTLITLDGTTLARRGQMEIPSPSAPAVVHPPSSNVVVTTDEGDLVAADIARGDAAWRAILSDDCNVKALFAVPEAVIVSDDSDSIRRIRADTGREVWRTKLGDAGALVYEGEAAEGDLVVATLKQGRAKECTAVGLDSATGAVRWRTAIPLAEENTIPTPTILASTVAYVIVERLPERQRSAVVLLDRATGRVLQEIEHPTIGRSYQQVSYGPDWIALTNLNEVAVYGRKGEPK